MDHALILAKINDEKNNEQGNYKILVLKSPGRGGLSADPQTNQSLIIIKKILKKDLLED